MGTTTLAPRAQRGRGAEIARRPPQAAETELFTRDRAGDPAAREELVRRFLPLARGLARRFRRGAEPLDDLEQVASFALVKAVGRFDPSRGVAFASFAVPTIVGELKRHRRDTSWAAYVPQRMRDRVLDVDRVTESLRLELGRSPTVGEVARETGIEPEQLTEALRAATAFDAVSLDADAASEGSGAAIADTLGSEEERYDLVEYAVTITPALRALPARQRAILRLRFEEDLTQSEIAARLGISQMHVSRLLRQALGRLREAARLRHTGLV
jgi:RNA polymerase sigma-B factor